MSKILIKGVYDKRKTTIDYIELLSNPENKINEIDVLNLVVKYSIDFIYTNSYYTGYHQPTKLKLVENILHKTLKYLLKKRKNKI